MQDPRASLRRQARAAQDALPPGFTIVAWYWDIESGALDLKDRSQGHAWEAFTDIGIPRDGGVAELLARACGPAPEFAVVVCEDIERAARDTLASLTLEKELARRGIPIFAADEPASLEGANPTTILVRRIRQGVAEFYRLQLLQKTWKGLVEHALDGWNIGPVPYGYLPDWVPHPAAAKAAQGRFKTRLIPDPHRGPVVTQIFTWRVDRKLAISTIAARLNADPAAYPPPGQAPGWAETTVTAILRNPKYTGHMVYGRTRKTPGSKKPRPVPPDQWIWTPDPKHEPLTSRDAWQTAQKTGAERGNIRDPEKPPAYPGRRYALRSRIRHAACQRRMCGIRRPSGSRTTEYVYYTCPYKASNPRHAVACPGHPATSVSVREDTIMAAITAFLDQYVFGYDRAAILKDRIPATTAEHAAARAREHARLTADLARIDTAQAGLLTELEQLGADTSPATQAYRTRIRARNSEYHDQRTATQTQLDTLNAAATPREDPALLDELPHLSTTLADAPAPLIENLLTALDIQVLYRPEQIQASIWATLTDTTPQTINALLGDPRTSTNHPPVPISDLTQDPLVQPAHRVARVRYESHESRRHGRGSRMRDPGNFDAFYSGSVRRVIGQLYALTGSRAEAEDCVQEAYARAWQRWDKVSDYGDPEAWVRTVAYRISISTWRKAANMRAAHRRHGVPDDPCGMSPDYVAIIAALRKISARQRQAIVLHHLVGLSVEEIASEIGAPTGTVKARLARGRQALAPHLTETDRAGTSLVPDPVTGISGREVSCEA